MSDNPNQQGEWLVQRIGKVTASRVKAVVARTTKKEYTAARREYLIEIVTQRLTGLQTPTFVNSAMQWGIDQEGPARFAYIEHTGNDVELVGFIQHPTLMAGASPDALVGLEEGGVEFKCPSSVRHAETILNGMPADHIPQIQMQMWICNLKWVDFVSWDPRFPKQQALYIQRIQRDDKYIESLEAEVRTFLAEVEQTIETLKEKCK
jgi:hypothetical protein